MCQATSQVVLPSACAASRSAGDTDRKTSRITEETNGITMIASTMPAVSMPMPSGGPLKSGPRTGSPPRWGSSPGGTWRPITGTKTNRPHKP
jgi:hypothetical protein